MKHDDLFEKFLDFCEENSKDTSVPTFVLWMSTYLSKLAYDSAPSHEIAHGVLMDGIDMGKRWSMCDDD